jgi:hypothetical protein
MKGNFSKTGKIGKAKRILVIRHTIKMDLYLLIDLFFNIMFTVHLVMILGKWPIWRTILFCVFVSILYMFRATSCSSSGESTVSIQPLVYVNLCRWPFRVQVGKERFPTCTRNGHRHRLTYHHENQFYQCNLWYISLCVGDRFVCRSDRFLSDLHTKRSPTQSDIYQKSYWYNWFSWWWAQGCSKHEDNWNKYIEKNCASSWPFTKNHY